METTEASVSLKFRGLVDVLTIAYALEIDGVLGFYPERYTGGWFNDDIGYAIALDSEYERYEIFANTSEITRNADGSYDVTAYDTFIEEERSIHIIPLLKWQ